MEARARKLRSDPHPYHHHHYEHQGGIGWSPTSQDFAERLKNALFHHLQLLYRSDPNLYVLGATGNVYKVSISSTPSCTCPDRVTPCKHILFVLIKVLGIPPDDPILRRETLKPSHIEMLRATPNCPESLANHTLREKFHQVLFLKKELGIRLKPCTCMEVEAGATCPICLEVVGKSGDRIVACEKCNTPIHEECLMTWKTTTTHQRKRLTKCVTCRSNWRGHLYQRYFNLAV
ncbi:Mitogen-activated protein kinase kinase kinase 1 [Bienertia sinuspersici]